MPPVVASASKQRSPDLDAIVVAAGVAQPASRPGQIAPARMGNSKAQTVLIHHHSRDISCQQERGGNKNAAAEPQMRVLSISRELDSMIYDHQQTRGGSTLVRASSSNVMLFSDLGNLRTSTTTTTTKTTRMAYNAEQAAVGEGNGAAEAQTKPEAPSLCRALSKRLDPDELKEMGNEEYKSGRYAEALAFYDRAIALDPRRAAYRSNKAAALAGMGRLLEAVAESREAVRMDPTYKRAHHRLAALYLRLGEADKALQQYKRLANEVDYADVSKAQNVQAHLAKLNEARMQKDWQTMLQEAEAAISSGADTAPQAFAAQAEALLKLQRHHEAESALIDAPIFNVDESTKFFGNVSSAYILAVRAQVNVASGKFDEAVSMANKASQIDPSNKDIAATSRKIRTMSSARYKGNELFKAGRFAEACLAYGEGLEHDSYNSILLCNRATCRAKMEQYEKAINDCTAALNVRPSYSKARLRRADCNLKLKKWDEALKDYEVLLATMPEDEEIKKAIQEAQTQIMMKNSSIDVAEPVSTIRDIIVATDQDELTDIIHFKGTSIILFCNKSSETEQIMPFMGQLCRKYTSFNFVKVEKEELIESQAVESMPTFRIYENGSILKDITGCDWDLLERSIKTFNTRFHKNQACTE